MPGPVMSFALGLGLGVGVRVHVASRRREKKRTRRGGRSSRDAAVDAVPSARVDDALRRASLMAMRRRPTPRNYRVTAPTAALESSSDAADADADAETTPAPPPPPPYASLSVPVYSLATAPTSPAGDSAGVASMNITTYACPVTIKPSRRMAVALYTHTATARNMLATGRGVLQVLRKRHAPLVELLGKRSAHDCDKMKALRDDFGIAVVERYGVRTIADVAGVMELKIVSIEHAGDHHLALCDVGEYESFEGDGEVLYTGDLPKAS